MLNKTICDRCEFRVNGFHYPAKPLDWHCDRAIKQKDGNMRWPNGREELPPNCPYYLEHVIFGGNNG